MMKKCDHADEDFGSPPEPEEVEKLTKGICTMCDLKGQRVGNGWRCNCCGAEWRVGANYIIAKMEIKVPLR